MLKEEPKTLEEIKDLREIIQINTISNNNSNKIRIYYNEFVNSSNVCMKCPGSILDALKRIKSKFTMEYLNQLENKIING